MKKTNIFINKHFQVGQIDPLIFSSFVEHLGRCIYTGIYEPDHPCANKDGFRQDVIDAVKELNIRMVRYPGGNFVSEYNWRDGIGENRPVRLGLAWCSIEPNKFGLHEFNKWIKEVNAIPMITVNMGTDTIKSAAEEVEYCNYDHGTYLSDLRIKNGSKEPFNVKVWSLGNEMDGDWQYGHISAEEYGEKARQAARMMRAVNAEGWGTKPEDNLKIIVNGSSTKDLYSFPEWDRIVLENTYDVVDYISIHRYYYYDKNSNNPIDDFLGIATDLDEYFTEIEGTIQFVKAKKRMKKDIYISFDEWNIWDWTIPLPNKPFDYAPALLEQNFTMLDSLAFAGLLNTILNHANSVKVACLSQLVNVIGPIFTEKGGRSFKQTIFYPFALASNNASGVTLRSENDSDSFESKYGNSKRINQAISYDENKKEISCFICNFADEENEINIDLSSFGKASVMDSQSMSSEDVFAKNGFETEKNIIPNKMQAKVNDSELQFIAKPYSYNFIKLKINE